MSEMTAYVSSLGPRATEASGSQARPLKEPHSGVRALGSGLDDIILHLLDLWLQDTEGQADPVR